MTEERKKLIENFQQFLNNMPAKGIAASGCANIAESFSNRQSQMQTLETSSFNELVELRTKVDERISILRSEKIKRLKNINEVLIKLEQDLYTKKWVKDYLTDKSGYWFEKEFNFPLFGKIMVTISPSDSTMQLEVKGDSNYADLTIGNIKTYNDVEKYLNSVNIKENE